MASSRLSPVRLCLLAGAVHLGGAARPPFEDQLGRPEAEVKLWGGYELPEVEAQRLLLQKYTINLRIDRVHAIEQGGGPRDGRFDEKVISERVSPEAIVGALEGLYIVGARRKGKQIWLELSEDAKSETPCKNLLVNFGMSGTIIFKNAEGLADAPQWPPSHTKLELELSDDTGRSIGMAFIDARRMGKILLRGADPTTKAPLNHKAPDPLDDDFGIVEFGNKLLVSKTDVKTMLLGSTNIVCGLGSWTADEVLYHAKIRPFASCKSLSDEQIDALHASLTNVISQACSCRSTSTPLPQEWLFHHRWKGRKEGQIPTPIGKVYHAHVAGKWSAYLPTFQKDGDRPKDAPPYYTPVDERGDEPTVEEAGEQPTVVDELSKMAEDLDKLTKAGAAPKGVPRKPMSREEADMARMERQANIAAMRAAIRKAKESEAGPSPTIWTGGQRGRGLNAAAASAAVGFPHGGGFPQLGQCCTQLAFGWSSWEGDSEQGHTAAAVQAEGAVASHVFKWTASVLGATGDPYAAGQEGGSCWDHFDEEATCLLDGAGGGAAGACAQPGFQLQAAATGEAMEGMEQAWLSEWRQRLECWFVGLPLPTQGQLGACLGALGIHVGSRLDAAWRALLPGSALPAAPGAGQTPLSAEPGCEWVERSAIELPDFPTLGEFEFTVPPLPRLLPSWERLQALSTGGAQIAAGNTAIHGSGTRGSSQLPQALGVGFGFGAGAGALVAVGALALKKRRTGASGVGRLSLRGSTKNPAPSSKAERGEATL